MAARRKKRPSAKTARAMPVVTIEGETVKASLPEGGEATSTVARLVERFQAGVPDTCGTTLPDGVKSLIPTPRGFIAVHQTPPSVFSFRWIASDSPIPYGPKAKYRKVRIALPFVVVFAVFERIGRRSPVLGGRNECFFSNVSIDAAGLATNLCFPALLNCSRFPDGSEHPLSWICTQNLKLADELVKLPFQESFQAGLEALLRHLFESGFNLSSEHHELSSWYTQSVAAGVDPRIETVEAWEKATAEDPLFVLDVPWMPTRLSVAEIGERIAQRGRGLRSITTSQDIAREVVHAGGWRQK